MYQVPEREYVEKGYWQPRTLGEELRISARRHADRTAVVAPDGSVSYGELDGMADEYAAGMAKLGIMPGDRVLVQLPNRLSLIVTAFALFRLGAVPIMALPASRQADVTALCALAEPVAYITTDSSGSVEYRSTVEALRQGQIHHYRQRED